MRNPTRHADRYAVSWTPTDQDRDTDGTVHSVYLAITILDLLARVVTVSLETMKIVDSLPSIEPHGQHRGAHNGMGLS